VDPETRPSLILRLGDQADDVAWAEFMEIYEPILFHLASRWGLQDADAREVVQETLLAVANAIPQFRSAGRGAFRAWLSAITRNKLADHLAKQSKQEQGSGDSKILLWLDQQACESSSASIWDWQAKRQIFAWAADRTRHQVSESTWAAFYRTSIRGEPVDLVAKDLGVREGMIYVARSRVMSRLRRHVESWTRREEA
jgi:RNA polymerase sigma-70 factor (ECF subfamily)